MTAYPSATVTQIALTDRTIAQLNQQMVLVYLGKPHISSAIHQQVIARFQSTLAAQQLLDPLRSIAHAARITLAQGDLVAYGVCMQKNTEAQRALHPMLISADADAIIKLAQHHDALGWKVNGAGGDGGSLVVLCNDNLAQRNRFVANVQQQLPHVQAIPIHYSPNGVHVTIQSHEAEV